MEEWTTVQFGTMPDLDTRRKMLAWVEESIAGRFLHFNTTDCYGRRSYGFRFQSADDALVFRERWLVDA